ncbi:MAG: hypothetical protein QME12_09485 [Nanoarchaeota archaeon]|nr:hypothetical protein [Nanoarchaeota archaeon]
MRARKILTLGAAVAGLVGLLGCGNGKPSNPRFERTDWPDSNGSYVITERGGTYRIFHHNCFSGKCYDSLINNFEGYVFFDDDTDGIVNRITFFRNNRWTLSEPIDQKKVNYNREDEGTEVMFDFADTEYPSAKKEMGVQ